MSGFEVGGIVLAVFPLVIGVIERLLAEESSFRLWEAQACRIELEAIQLEIQVQEALFQNSYLKLLLSFLNRRQIVKLLADPDSLRKNHVEITNNLKIHLGEQWTVYQGVMRRLENTLQAFKASVDKVHTGFSLLRGCRCAYGDCELTRVCEKKATAVDENGDELSKIKLLLHRIRFSFYTRQRSGLLKRLKDDNETLATLTDQQRTLRALGTDHNPDVTVDAAICRDIRRQAVDLFHSLAGNVTAKSEHWLAQAARIFFTSFMPPDWADRPIFSIALSGQDQDGLSRCIEWQIARCLDIDHEYFSICPSYRDLCAVASSVPHNNLSASLRLPERRLPSSLPLGCLQSSADPSGGYTLKLKAIAETPISISLADIVSADRRFDCYPRYFLENDRARLAAILASSLLCLNDSPWLKDSWSSRDVLFETSSGDVKRESLLRPHSQVDLPHRSDQLERPSAPFGILSPPLYSLGMVLLELILNETLESRKQSDDETEFEVAWRLEREVCRMVRPFRDKLLFI